MDLEPLRDHVEPCNAKIGIGRNSTKSNVYTLYTANISNSVLHKQKIKPRKSKFVCTSPDPKTPAKISSRFQS